MPLVEVGNEVVEFPDSMSPEEISAVIKQQFGGAQNAPPMSATATLNAATPGAQALQQQMVGAYGRGDIAPGGLQIKGPTLPGQETYQELNQAQGVPLDTQTGFPGADRAKMAMLGSDDSRLKFLVDRFGPENVRVDTEGTPIVRMTDEQGQPRDILVDERRMTGKDLLDMVDLAPELLGAMVGVGGGRGMGLLSKFKGLAGAARDVVAGAVGGQVAGGASDTISQAAAGQLPNMPEIAQRRAANAGLEMATGGLLSAGAAGARGLLQRVVAPFAGQAGPVQQQAVQAVQDLKSRTGIELMLSPAEKTGNEFLSMGETFLGNVPGGKGKMGRAMAKREEAIRAFQGYVMGTGSLPDNQAIGKRVVDLFDQTANAKRTASTAAEKEAVRQLDETILGELDRLSVADRQLLTPDVGRNIRTAVAAKRDAFKAESRTLYDLVAADPNGKKAIVPSVRLRNAIRDIEKELVKDAGKVVKEVSPILDAKGRPTVIGEKLVRETIPALNRGDILAKLGGLKRLPDNMTLDEVRNVRRAINDLIEAGQSLPDVPTRHLVKLANSLTESMSDAVRGLPSGELKDKLARANKFYRENNGQYRESGIADLFRPTDAPGYVGDAEVVRRIVANGGNPDALFQAKRVLGDASPEYAQLKRMALEAVYDTTLLDLDGKMASASAIVDRITRLDKSVRKELFDDVAIANLSAVQSLAKHLGKGEIDLEVFKTALAGKTKLYQALDKARKAFQDQRRVFNNKVMQPFLRGEGDVTAIAPEDFVHKWLGLASVDQTKEAMNLIAREDQALMSKIRRKTIQDIFQSAARAPKGEDILRNIEGDATAMVSAKSMYNAVYKDPAAVAKYKAVLGPTTMQNLEDYLKFEIARETKNAIGKNAGGLVGGNITADILSGSPQGIVRAGKFRLAAAILNSPLPLRYLGSNVEIPDITTITPLIAASEPIMRQLVEEFGDESPGLIRMLDTMARGLTGQTQPGTQPGQPTQPQP